MSNGGGLGVRLAGVVVGEEGAVAAAVDPLAGVGAAGGIDRGSTGVAGVMVGAGKASDVAAVADELDRQHGRDSEDLGQSGRTARQELLAAGAIGSQLPVQAAKVGQEVAGQRLALLVSRGARA